MASVLTLVELLNPAKGKKVSIRGYRTDNLIWDPGNPIYSPFGIEGTLIEVWPTGVMVSSGTYQTFIDFALITTLLVVE